MTLHKSIQTTYKHDQFWKKQEKLEKNVQFCWTFLTVKSYFFKNGPAKWVLVFCVAISMARHFFWAIKRRHPTIFIFHLCKGRALFFKNCPSLTKVKNENCWMATIDSLKEASCHTDCNAKNQNSFRWTIFEKIRLDRQKSPKKLDIFF